MATSKNTNSASRLGSHDPGWNDPPLFSYDEHTAQLNSTKPKTLLNKRKSFPMDSSPKPTASCLIDPTLPPQTCNPDSLPPPPIIAICPAKIESAAEQIEADNESHFNSEEALASVVSNFNSVLNSSDLKNKSDIERRLDLMKKMWSDGKYNKDIEIKLLQLSEAVKERNYKVANDLQISLMVDHPSLCSPWMSGVRYLIQRSAEGIEQTGDS